MSDYLMLDTFAGRRLVPCVVLKETPKRFKIRLLESAVLPGNRRAEIGYETLVPKYAICSSPRIIDARQL